MKLQHTVQELLLLSTDYLEKKGCASPRLDAELLLGHVLQVSRMDLYLNLGKPLTLQEVDAYRACIGKRGQRIPVAYITGKREFYSLPFLVSPGVLIPRPETELLVEKVVQLGGVLGEELNRPLHILELGTGSGAIAVSIARNDPNSRVTAVDISAKALQVAAKNADRLEVAEQVQVVESDLYSNVQGKYDIICSNPPYIPAGEIADLQVEVGFEPELALDGGKDGLDYYRRILSEAGQHLEKPGYVVVEIGWNQGAAVRRIGEQHSLQWQETIPDYAGHDRVVVFKWT